MGRSPVHWKKKKKNTRMEQTKLKIIPSLGFKQNIVCFKESISYIGIDLKFWRGLSFMQPTLVWFVAHLVCVPHNLCSTGCGFRCSQALQEGLDNPEWSRARITRYHWTLTVLHWANWSEEQKEIPKGSEHSFGETLTCWNNPTPERIKIKKRKIIIY